MKIRDLFIVGFSAIVLGLAISVLGMIHFGGLDGSAVVQSAWRFYLGQVPYRDFLTAAPASYLVLPGLGFCLFGVSWHAIVLVAALFSAFALVLHYVILIRIGWGFRWAFILSAVTQVAAILPLCFLHYNQSAAVSAVLFGSASCLLAHSPKNRANQVLFIITMILMSWMKPNIAGLMLVGSSVFLLLDKRTRVPFVYCAGIAVVLSISLMLCFRLNPFGLVASYMGSSGGRLWNFLNLYRNLWRTDALEASITFLLLSPLFAALMLRGNPFKGCVNSGPFFVTISHLGAVSTLTGFVGMATNCEHNMVDAVMVLSGMCFLIFNASDPSEVAAKSTPLRQIETRLCDIFAFTGVVFLGLFGFLMGLSRFRVESIGQNMFFQDAKPLKVFAPPFFAGLRTGEIFLKVLQDIEATLAAAGLTDKESVFFGPRMEFAYAAYQFIPPKNQYLFWPGTGEARPEEIEGAVSDFIKWNPKLCIFLLNDFTYMPQSLLIHLSAHYDVSNTQTLTVLRLRETK
ncbi:MAG: hypothetical protein SFU85_07770 [Candidatus Methylacidiphilales bacterium]|nr:hypothetical protein [Candidatus Methylacidiphilales bacterium]